MVCRRSRRFKRHNWRQLVTKKSHSPTSPSLFVPIFSFLSPLLYPPPLSLSLHFFQLGFAGPFPSFLLSSLDHHSLHCKFSLDMPFLIALLSLSRRVFSFLFRFNFLIAFLTYFSFFHLLFSCIFSWKGISFI